MRPPLAPLLSLARLCPCVLLFYLLGDSVKSQFLRDRVLPPGCRCFRAFILMVSLLVRFSWCPFSSVPISLLPSLSCVGYPLLRRVFLEVYLPLLVASWLSRLRLFCFYSSFLRLCPLRGFPSYFLFPLLFLLFSFRPVAVRLSISFNLLCFFSFYWGETLVSSLASSLRSSASVLQRLFGRCAWRRHLSPLFRCVLGIPSLARSYIGCSV